MLQKLQDIREAKKEGDGFTIIEVMIVLAIAGLILVVVLIAIPQLQRNQRNSSRQSIMARISTELGNYAGNNNGRIPQNTTDISSFTARYLDGIDINDPSSGTAMTVTYADPLPTAGAVPTVGVGAALYADNRSCDGEVVAAGSARSFALYTQLEGGAIYCLDNE